MKEIWHFLLHLRLHYQVGILSGCYLLGALFIKQLDVATFWLQFVNVHFLLFAGATAFNSYWDKDEGPIGGLKNPPPMTLWMRNAAMLMQFVGLAWASTVSLTFAGFYAFSMILFWLYSTPLFRWKSHPFLSMIAIGGSTGVGGFMLGFSAGGGYLSWLIIATAIGASLILLSMYPVSQIYQKEDDKKRGDETFAVRFGMSGVVRFFMIAFIPGILIVSFAMREIDAVMSGFFLSITAMSGLVIWIYLRQLKGIQTEYPQVMRLKFLASVLFVLFILICYFQIHIVDAGRVLQTNPERLAFLLGM